MTLNRSAAWITAACLLGLTQPAGAQDAQATSWQQIFKHGYPSIQALATREDVNLDSSASYFGSFHGRCDVAAPDSIFLVASASYSRGQQSWRPSFSDVAPQDGNHYNRIDAPSHPDTMLVQVDRALCDPHGVLTAFVVRAADRFVYLDTPEQPWLGLVWAFGRSPTGRPVPLRWAPTTRQLETFDQARARWRRLHWGRQTIASVLTGNIRIGMTADMVREAWGVPQSVNRTTTALGTQEQWVYGETTFAYLENGRLTAVQN